MSRAELDKLSLNRLLPFGAELTAAETPGDFHSINVALLKALVEENRVVVLRGFAPLINGEFPDFCRGFGDLQEWEFGVVNSLRVDPQAKNYLYTNRAVPFHWDGAFAGQLPHYIIFHCDATPAGGGGETLFTDTRRLLTAAPRQLLDLWRKVVINYTTEKVVHYGGTFSSPLITAHPANGKEILRFAEPVFDLNPVRLEIHGLSDLSEADFLADMHGRLHDDAFCYRHSWRRGDLVIADNYVLLHGRREFAQTGARRIRRVNVL